MLGYLKTDAFERKHRIYPASYLWVFMDRKFVRLTENGDVFRRGGAPDRIQCVRLFTFRKKQFKSAYKKLK